MTTAIHTTMLDVVQAVSEYAASDAEVVATVAYLINSGRVLLCGTFAGVRIDLSTPAGAAPPSATATLWTRSRESPPDVTMSYTLSEEG